MTKQIFLTVFFGPNLEVCLILFCISVPTYFIWKFIYKKYIPEIRKQKKSIWISTIISTPIIYLGLIFIFIYVIFYEPTIDFNKSQWLSKKEVRFKMADGIVKSKMLIAKDISQVKELLGQPTLQDSMNLYWNYDMGMATGGLGFVFHNLSINFENGKVVSVLHNRIQD